MFSVVVPENRQVHDPFDAKTHEIAVVETDFLFVQFGVLIESTGKLNFAILMFPSGTVFEIFKAGI